MSTQILSFLNVFRKKLEYLDFKSQGKSGAGGARKFVFIGEDCNLGAPSAGTKCVFAPQAATHLRFGAAGAENLTFSNITPR